MSSRPPAAAERGPSANGRRGGASTPAPAAALPQRPYPPPLSFAGDFGGHRRCCTTLALLAGRITGTDRGR